MSDRVPSERIGLQRRFFFSFAFLIVGLMVVVASYVVSREGQLLRTEAEKRATAVAVNLAAAADTALRTYNYVALEQFAAKAARDEDVRYVIFLDKEGVVAAHSARPDLLGTRLTDPVSRAAAVAQGPLAQETRSRGADGEDERVLDVAVPVRFAQSPETWGTVRIGLSLEPLEAEVRRTRAALLGVGLAALLAGIGGASVLARRITRPVARLAAGARELAAGRVGVRIEVRTGDELQALADAFNHMSAELGAKQAALEQNLALVDALRRYQDDILRSMDEGLLTVDLEGRVVTVNRLGGDLLGLDAAHLAARPALESVLDPRSPLVRLVREGLAQDEPTGHAEVELARGETAVPLGVSMSPLRDSSGERLGLLVLFRDLTEMKALEARMRRTDRLAALGTMAAGLAHEIKNPLAAIKTFVQLLPRKVDSEAFRDRFNVTVPRELDRVNGIVDNLLEVARTPRMTFGPVDLNGLLRRTLDLHRAQMEERAVQCDVRLAEGLPLARADGEHLLRAFSNLVLNALEAMPEGGRLTVTTRHAGANGHQARTLEVGIADTGAGMDVETVGQLFNPFFTTKAKGTGLGLALTHKIIEEHGGTIAVQSEPGMGTVFTLTLPEAQPA